MSTVGPYLKYGLGLVAACAKNGTHYADLTGETLFVRQIIDDYDELAQSTGARIVNSCGFDSIPSDLGVLLAFEHARDHGLGHLTDTTLVVRAMKGGFSGGTIDSMRTTVDVVKADPKLKAIVNDKFALSPDRSNEPTRPQPKDTALVARSSDVGGWVGPFVMADYNTKIVRRSMPCRTGHMAPNSPTAKSHPSARAAGAAVSRWYGRGHVGRMGWHGDQADAGSPGPNPAGSGRGSV